MSIKTVEKHIKLHKNVVMYKIAIYIYQKIYVSSMSYVYKIGAPQALKHIYMKVQNYD